MAMHQHEQCSVWVLLVALGATHKFLNWVVCWRDFGKSTVYGLAGLNEWPFKGRGYQPRKHSDCSQAEQGSVLIPARLLCKGYAVVAIA